VTAPRPLPPVRTADGRQITLAETGDPAGMVAFYLHGTGSSRLEVEHYATAAAAHEVRLVCWDRPGAGGSTRQPGRRLTSVVDDVRTVGRTLGVDSVPVVGHSGGGSHVLALAATAGDLVSRAVAINPGPPAVDDVLADLDPTARRVITLARDHPRAYSMVSRLLQAKGPIGDRLRRRSLDPTDLEVMSHDPARTIFEAAAAEGSRQAGAYTEEALIIWHQPWAFSLAAFPVPVHVFAGLADPFLTFSRRLTQAGAVGHEFPGGHVSGFVPDVMAHVMAVLRDR